MEIYQINGYALDSYNRIKTNMAFLA